MKKEEKELITGTERKISQPVPGTCVSAQAWDWLRDPEPTPRGGPGFTHGEEHSVRITIAPGKRFPPAGRNPGGIWAQD